MTTAFATRRQAMRALREIAQALSAAWELDTTLQLIVQKTTEVMAVASCTLYLLEPDGKTLRLQATTGLGAETLGYATLQVGEGMTGRAVDVKRPVHAAIAHDHPAFKWVDRLSEAQLQSLLAVPLVLGERPIGAINVQTAQTHAYSEDEIEMLLLIADLAAGAVAKAQRYDRQRSQLEELRALARLSEAINAPHYLDDMLDIVTELAAQSLKAAVCSLYLVDETEEQLVLRSAKRVTVSYADRPPLRLGEGIIGRVAAGGRQQYVADIGADSRFAYPDLAHSEGLVSMLAAPLTVRERTIGVLVCYTDERRQFSDGEQALFSTLANQTALAIENARLVTHAAVVREMHHRIKNNLQTVAMLMQLQLPNAERLDTREVLQTNIHRIRSIASVHEVLSEKGFHLVDVKEVFERIAAATIQAVAAPERRIEIAVRGESLTLPSQRATALALVINELVQNAVEHAFSGRSEGHIQISIGRTQSALAVWVRDDGVGMQPDFEHGMGLEIALALVEEDLGGKMQFWQRDPGTEVEIQMPRSVER